MKKSMFFICILIMPMYSAAGFWSLLGSAYEFSKNLLKGQDALKEQQDVLKKLEKKEEELNDTRKKFDQLIFDKAQQDRESASRTATIMGEFKSEKITLKKESITYQKKGVELQEKGNNISENTNMILKDGIDKITTENPLQQAAQMVAIGSGAVYIAKTGYEAAKGTYSYFYPSQEQLLHQEEVVYKLARRRAKKILNECLAYNMDSIKNADGVPATCEDAFKKFESIVGRKKGNELKEELKK